MKFPFIGIGKQKPDRSPGREILLILLLMIFIEHLLCAKHCVDCWEFSMNKMTFLPLPSLLSEVEIEQMISNVMYHQKKVKKSKGCYKSISWVPTSFRSSGRLPEETVLK